MSEFNLTPQSGVPDFIAENPLLIFDAFCTDPRLTIGEVVDQSCDFLKRRMPFYCEGKSYNSSAANPQLAIGNLSGNCLARAAALHGLFSCFGHLQSGLVMTYNHAYNVVVERHGSAGAVIRNDMECDEFDRDIGIVLPHPPMRVAEKKEFITHELRGALVFYTHERRDDVAGKIELWHFTPKDNSSRENVKGKPYEEVCETKPQEGNDQNPSELRPHVVLLGKSATHLVNHLTGHRPLRTGDRAVDVLSALRTTIKPKVPATSASGR